MLNFIHFLSIFLLFAPSILKGQSGDYPSCIGLELATNFFFSGDVTSQAVCEEACSTLYMDETGDVVYDTSSLEDGTTVQFCECGSQGVLCQDVVEGGGGDGTTEDTTSPTTVPTAAPTTSSATDAPGVEPDATPEPTGAGGSTPVPPTATPTSSANSNATRVLMALVTFVAAGLMSL